MPCAACGEARHFFLVSWSPSHWLRSILRQDPTATEWKWDPLRPSSMMTAESSLMFPPESWHFPWWSWCDSRWELDPPCTEAVSLQGQVPCSDDRCWTHDRLNGDTWLIRLVHRKWWLHSSLLLKNFVPTCSKLKDCSMLVPRCAYMNKLCRGCYNLRLPIMAKVRTRQEQQKAKGMGWCLWAAQDKSQRRTWGASTVLEDAQGFCGISVGSVFDMRWKQM